MWLDISNPTDPIVMWADADSRASAVARGGSKEKDQLRLIEIIDIRAGRVGNVFMRSGNDADAPLYISFSAEARTLDAEFVTPETRDFVFRKFADLFQAYATAQMEKLRDESITLRVAGIMDAGASSKVGGSGPGTAAHATAAAAAPRAAAARQQQPFTPRSGGAVAVP
jgi:hypothetical protein